jgi:hypothetical protein
MRLGTSYRRPTTSVLFPGSLLYLMQPAIECIGKAYIWCKLPLMAVVKHLA